ncbi:MAG: tripartite tricarboxylate transporter TctB family protein [Betaproteobacteria bacterium]|nr:tripartite tricarboxylate transporter TctB family protein [Betaproteobacteria bacterium]
MNIKSQKDFFSGLTFMVLGIAFAWGATSYKVGEGSRMGPGYFPLLLGVLMAILGGVITFKSLVVETEDGDKMGKWVWRPVGYIVAANLVFGILLGGLPSIKLPSMGLVVAIFALTLISARAGSEFILKEILILSLVLCAGSYLCFIMLLKLQMQVWPAFITG